MTGNLLTVTVERSGRRTVVHVSGEVDMGTKPLLEAAVVRALTEDPPDTLLVDLTGTTFLASAGLAVLAGAHTRAEESTVSLAVVVTSGSAAERALAITGLDRVFPVVNTLDQRSTDSR